MQFYDVRVKVPEGNDLVECTQQALMQILAKLQLVNKHVIIYPWEESNQKQRVPVITKPEDFPSLLSNLRIYVHRLYIRPSGGTCHPRIFFGFMAKPEAIMENIGWWFKTTDQGMWQMPLQKAEETVCLGWLLYSADKYNREALCREIWQFTGVSVALRF